MTTGPIIPDEDITSPGPFEGPEKLLEVWFAPSPDTLPESSSSSSSGRRLQARAGGYAGLRRVPRAVWEEMLDIVKCKVLSVVEGDDVDAYLLSESSLFVAPHLLILKTCGTTLNLLGLYRIIEIAREYCGFTTIWRCFYSRKSFFFPDRQQGPHKDWRDEVRFLDSVFGSSGSAYTVGPMNRDHWLLYLTSPNAQPILPTESPQHSIAPPAPAPALPLSSPPLPPPAAGRIYQDTTLEILMSHLSPKARAPFFHPDHPASGTGTGTPGHILGTTISQTLGIDTLFPRDETVLDSFGFEPCGYSANAVIGSGSPHTSSGRDGAPGGYYTIHVTPEDGWSYASFECNVPLPSPGSSSGSGSPSRPDLATLIRKVVDIFEPSRLSITLFVSTPTGSAATAVPASLAPNTGANIEQVAWTAFGKDLLGDHGYDRKDRIGYEFDGYDLVFACFEKSGWVEPNPATAIGAVDALKELVISQEQGES